MEAGALKAITATHGGGDEGGGGPLPGLVLFLCVRWLLKRTVKSSGILTTAPKQQHNQYRGSDLKTEYLRSSQCALLGLAHCLGIKPTEGRAFHSKR